MPTLRPTNRNSPRASVTCVCEPVLPVTVTVAPGSTPPCWSSTRPVMVPVSVWASEGSREDMTAGTAATTT